MLTASMFTISCSDDDTTNTAPETTQPKEYKFQIWGYSLSQTQYPMTVTYYKDIQNGSLATEIVNSQTNTDVIESRNLSTYDKLGFKLAVGNGGNATINTVIITDVEADEIIFEEYSLQVNTGQTFMYDLSDDTYSVQ